MARHGAGGEPSRWPDAAAALAAADADGPYPDRAADFARVLVELDDRVDDPGDAKRRLTDAMDAREPGHAETLGVVADGRLSVAEAAARAGVDPVRTSALDREFAEVDKHADDEAWASEQKRWLAWNHVGESYEGDDRRAVLTELRHEAYRAAHVEGVETRRDGPEDRASGFQPVGWNDVSDVVDRVAPLVGLDETTLSFAFRATTEEEAITRPATGPEGDDPDDETVLDVFGAAVRAADRPVRLDGAGLVSRLAERQGEETGDDGRDADDSRGV